MLKQDSVVGTEHWDEEQMMALGAHEMGSKLQKGIGRACILRHAGRQYWWGQPVSDRLLSAIRKELLGIGSDLCYNCNSIPAL